MKHFTKLSQFRLLGVKEFSRQQQQLPKRGTTIAVLLGVGVGQILLQA